MRPARLLWLCVWLAHAGASAQSAPLRITFLDVGQGDAVLIQTPEGKTALVDAGPGVDLVPRLATLGVDTLDLMVASHAHADHIGGMLRVLEGLPVRSFMDNGLPYNTATYRRLMAAVRARQDVRYLEATPRTLTFGSVEIVVLPRPPNRDGEEQNNQSVPLLVRSGAFLALLTGDSERDELAWLVSQKAVPEVALLKAPHHGSANGYTRSFLGAARPQVVVISVGSNDYGHPSAAALGAYAARGQVLRTDRDGDVTVLGFRDGHFEVEAAHHPRRQEPGR